MRYPIELYTLDDFHKEIHYIIAFDLSGNNETKNYFGEFVWLKVQLFYW